LDAIGVLVHHTGIGEIAGRWVATAKNDAGQFHVAKAGSEG